MEYHNFSSITSTVDDSVDNDNGSATTEELIITTDDPLDLSSPGTPPDLTTSETDIDDSSVYSPGSPPDLTTYDSDVEICSVYSPGSPHNLTTYDSDVVISAVNSPTPVTDRNHEDPDGMFFRRNASRTPWATSSPTVHNSTSCTNCKLKTFASKSAGRSQQIRDEIVAIRNLEANYIALSLLDAPRERLRSFLHEKISFPRPTGTDNFLNVMFDDGKTLFHGSVLLNRYDITDLLLSYGADVNIREDNRTVLHRPAERNDTLLFTILCSYGADLSAYNDIGETALLTAIAFDNMEILSSLWQETRHYIPSAKGESVIHNAARYNNITLAKFACDPRHRIDVNLVSFHEKRTALYIAVMDSRTEIVEILLQRGACDHQADIDGYSACEYIRNGTIEKIFRRLTFKKPSLSHFFFLIFRLLQCMHYVPIKFLTPAYCVTFLVHSTTHMTNANLQNQHHP